MRHSQEDVKYKGASQIIGFLLFGLREDQLLIALQKISRLHYTSGSFIPLILTDFQDHSILRKAGAIIEYFPTDAYAKPDQRVIFNSRFRAS
ncbi:hypothetical protein AB9F29_21770, partial [Falsihalocynthiibacter sp. S25ZX9]|uniref:hypothetical protein n=1 Tax=Falsihalocynthiibacter sp. S25ZX9 TaxID=3240870 RepID=UPI00350F5AEC